MFGLRFANLWLKMNSERQRWPCSKCNWNSTKKSTNTKYKVTELESKDQFMKIRADALDLILKQVRKTERPESVIKKRRPEARLMSEMLPIASHMVMAGQSAHLSMEVNAHERVW